MQRVGLLAISDAVDFVLQALEALQKAHSAGIVHRDLKPANLFLATRPDGTRIVKVLDFGISKSLFGTSRRGDVAHPHGRADRLAPVHVARANALGQGRRHAHRHLVLGVMLYEMLTGRPPYTGDSIPALCAALLNDQPTPMHELRAEIAPSLEEAVMRCLAKDRQHRFNTVSELARALAPFGSSGSQVHVDRASRVQGATDVTISAFSAAPMTARNSAPARTQPQPTPSQLVVTPIQGSPHSAPPMRGGTIDSWGRTDGPQPIAARRSRAGLFAALGLGLVALLSIAGYLGTRPPPRARLPPLASNRRLHRR